MNPCVARVTDSTAPFAVDMRPKLLFNPDSRSPNFFLPGLTAILLLNVTTFLTAFAIVREKERGTLEQLFVTPVRPFGLLLGKLLPYFFIGFFELCHDSLFYALRFPRAHSRQRLSAGISFLALSFSSRSRLACLSPAKPIRRAKPCNWPS